MIPLLAASRYVIEFIHATTIKNFTQLKVNLISTLEVGARH